MREATKNDIKDMVELGKMFYEKTILPAYVPYDEVSIACILTQYIDNDKTVVFVMEKDGRVVGGIMGQIIPLYWNLSCFAGQQLGWFVHPEYRGAHSLRLIEAFEQWAKEQGAHIIFSGAKMNERYEMMDRLLSHRGYESLESVHVKGVA